jgi:hypothetical protein
MLEVEMVESVVKGVASGKLGREIGKGNWEGKLGR